MSARTLIMTMPLLVASTVANANNDEPVFDPNANMCPPSWHEDEAIVIEGVLCENIDGVPVYGTYYTIVRHHYTWSYTPVLQPDCTLNITQEPLAEWTDCP